MPLPHANITPIPGLPAKPDATSTLFNTRYTEADDNFAYLEASKAALAGIASITLSGSDVTLTAAQYACPVIVLTGTLTANVNLIFPATAGAQWLVINNCTGAHYVTVKTASGSGAGVYAGSDVRVYADGGSIKRIGNLRQKVIVFFGNLVGTPTLGVTWPIAFASAPSVQVSIETAIPGPVSANVYIYGITETGATLYAEEWAAITQDIKVHVWAEGV